MKLKSIQIKNFQSHRNTNIQLDPGVNVIVGRSDVGKSSILRALNWVIANKPSGDGFVSNWDPKTTEVHLNFEDGEISRIRKTGFNGYVLKNEEFKGFGQIVPDEIAQFLNINTLNIQSQFDTPFMISWSSGDRGLFLNKIIDLEITDNAIRNIKSNILSDKHHITSLETDITQLQKQLETYDYLDALESDISRIEKNQKELDEITTRSDNLLKIVLSAEDSKKEIGLLIHIPTLLKEIKSIDDEIKEAEKIINTRKRIESIISAIDKSKKTIKGLKDTSRIARSIEDAVKDIDEQKTIHKTALELDALIDNIENNQELIKATEIKLDVNKKELSKHLKDKCPLCGK